MQITVSISSHMLICPTLAMRADVRAISVATFSPALT